MTFQMPATLLPDHKSCGPGNSVANRHSPGHSQTGSKAKMHSPPKAGNLEGRTGKGFTNAYQ